MFYFVLETIAVSIVVSIFAYWIKFIPNYSKRKHAILMQSINSGLLTVLLACFFVFDVYPSSVLLFLMIFFVLWVSVRFTNRVIRTNEEPVEKTIESEGKTT